jgi:hypothetical protein
VRPSLASGAYTEPAPGTPSRICRNAYLEKIDTDPKRPLRLVKAPGSLKLPDWAANARGYAQADGFASGVILVVVGTALKTYDPATGTVGTITGTVAGTDRVQFAFTALECAILANGVLHFSDGAAVAAATDVDFPAAITSVAAIEQRFVFSYGTEGRWGYTEVGDGDNTTVISYYTAEYSPDGLVALFVLGARLFLFGSQTLEEWYPTGDSDNPFRRASGRVVETGCLCRDSIRKLDNTVYWIDRECSVRRIGSAETPEIVSTPAISRAIRATDSDDIICMAYEVDGHAFYIVRLPDEGCFALDPNTGGEWHERQTNLTDTWRYGYIVSAAGQHFVGDFAGVGFAILSRDYESEHMADVSTMGTEIVLHVTAYASISEGIEDVNTVRLEVSPGQGLSTGQGSAPVFQMRKWRGQSFTSWRSRSTGAQGRYRTRVIWTGCGLAYPPGLWLEFRGSDPVRTVISGCAVNED